MIVGITGNALDEEVAQFIHAGADLVLMKPLLMETMQALLHYCVLHGTTTTPGMKLQLRDTSLHLVPEPEYF